MRPIFNKKVAKKYNLCDPWTVHGYTFHSWLVNNDGLNKKKKAENVDVQHRRTIQTAPVIKKGSGSFLIFPKRSIETSSLLAKNCKK